jgi:hypothetical protein
VKETVSIGIQPLSNLKPWFSTSIMFRTTLHTILLLVVAYSQVLGGVSCCCLGRSLVEGICGMPLATGDAEVAGSNSIATQPPRCAKCTARPTGKPAISAQPAAKTSSRSGLGVCQGGQCNCGKFVLNANEPTVPVSVSAKSFGWVSVVFTPKIVLIAPSCVGKFEIPLRFGGRLWQSIACVWKN